MPNSTSLCVLFSDFYAPRKLRGLTANTATKYRIALKYFAVFLERLPTIDDLDDDLVEGFLRWMTEQGKSPYTANSYGSKIVALWTYLSRKGLAPTGPSVKRLRQPKRIPIGWTDDEVQRLFKACSERSGMVAGIPARIWWTALHSVLLDTGERITAILRTERSTLNLSTGYLVVPAEVRKGQTEDMLYRLQPDTLHIVRMLLDASPDSARLFPWDLDRSSIWNHLRRILADAGLPTDRKHKFHCWRKTRASRLKRDGKDPRRALGHSSDAVTDAYLDPRIIDPDQAA